MLQGSVEQGVCDCALYTLHVDSACFFVDLKGFSRAKLQSTLPNIMEVLEGSVCNARHVGVQNGSVAASCEHRRHRLPNHILAIPMSLACGVFGNQSRCVICSMRGSAANSLAVWFGAVASTTALERASPGDWVFLLGLGFRV